MTFWERRRAAVAAEEEAGRRAAEARAETEQRADLEALSDDEICAKLGLPDPDALEPGDNVSGFMARAVPERLRRRALRKFWRTNPALANLDGLIDYGEDYTDAATVVENLQTAYRVGKGMLERVKRLEEGGEAVEEGGGEGSAPTGRADSADGNGERKEPGVVDGNTRTSSRETRPGQPLPAPERTGDSAPRRRMKFHFPEETA